MTCSRQSTQNSSKNRAAAQKNRVTSQLQNRRQGPVGSGERPTDGIRIAHGGDSLPGSLFGGHPLGFQKTYAVV